LPRVRLGLAEAFVQRCDPSPRQSQVGAREVVCAAAQDRSG